jgi:signal transduction histidine kinase
MRLGTSLYTRVILGTVVTALAVVIGIYAIVHATIVEVGQSWAHRLVDRELLAEWRERCEADPANAASERADGLRVVPFDVRTGRSLSGAVDSALAEELERGAPTAVRVDWLGREVGARLLVAVGREGPCSAFQIDRPLDHLAVKEIRVAWATAIFVAIFVLLVGALVTVLRPLLRRLTILERAVAGVGSPEVARLVTGPDELGTIAEAMARAFEQITLDRERILREVRVRDEFIADISHDVRTPTTSLQLALEELDEVVAKDAPDARPILRRALADVVYIASLVANLAMARKLTNDDEPLAPLRPVDLRSIAERVAVRGAIFAKRQGVTVEYAVGEDPVLVLADAVIAEQMITNVVENAIRYNEVGGRVALTLDRDGDGRFVVHVRDDGPGVAPDELPRLGERTFRSSFARERDPRGSGLGLAIVRAGCDRFGWGCGFAGLEPRGLEVALAGPVLREAPPSLDVIR